MSAGWFWTILAGLAVVYLCQATPQRDDTDPPNGASGMMLYTDHGTGCQYLGARFGLVPRLGKNGKPMCGGK